MLVYAPGIMKSLQDKYWIGLKPWSGPVKPFSHWTSPVCPITVKELVLEDGLTAAPQASPTVHFLHGWCGIVTYFVYSLPVGILDKMLGC